MNNLTELSIQLVITGGTVSSDIDTYGISRTGKNESALLEILAMHFSEQFPDEKVTINCGSPYLILSENLSHSHMLLLKEYIRHEVKPDTDAVFIALGTDTLAYMAAFLFLTLAGSDLRVFLISGDRPISDSNSTARINIASAVKALRTGDADPGVYVPVVDPVTGIAEMVTGDRITQAEAYFDDFRSISSERMKTCGIADIFAQFEKPVPSTALLYTDTEFDGRVLQIRPYPGIDFSMYDPADVDAVLLGCYHSFTVPVAESLLNFAQKCRESGVGFYMAPSPDEELKGFALYESRMKLISSGLVTMLRHMSFETAYCALVFAYSNG